jgi:hypothetical protein
MGTPVEVGLRKDGWIVKYDMIIKGVNMEMTSDRRELIKLFEHAALLYNKSQII